MTALEVIVAAYQELGIVVSGGSPNANDTAWGLGKLNRMLQSWSSDGINLHSRTEESFNLASETASYTIGPGADFDTVRPIVIESAFIRENGHDYPVGVRPMGEYWDLAEKSTKDRPVKLYYDPAYFEGVVYFYYTPDAAYSLHLVSQKPLITYVSASAEVLLPGNYEDAIILNLAIRMASRYGKKVFRELRIDAQNALSGLRALHLSSQMQGVELSIPGMRGAGYNVNADC